MRRDHGLAHVCAMTSRTSLIAVAIGIVSYPTVAAAQVQPPTAAQPNQIANQTITPPAVPGAPRDEIVVTGSRLPSGIRAPTPLTVIGTQAIENREPATVGEILQQIPSFAGIDSPNTAGVNSRGGAQINPDLRGLGATRTLVLINGRRHVPTATSNSVDVKVVPTLLVSRVEVVTGGASAAYGSDAVSGWST